MGQVQKSELAKTSILYSIDGLGRRACFCAEQLYESICGENYQSNN